MLKYDRLEPRFVDYIPEILNPGEIYISKAFATAAHKCCCGCGEEVVTPLGPTDWKLTFDGVAVSLWPSVGNWNSGCRSHYILRYGRILEAPPWTDSQVKAAQSRDRRAKVAFFNSDAAKEVETRKHRGRFWAKLAAWWCGR